MADVSWIKIVTDIFDDEKILLIETMPEADSIIVMWFKLLCLAGKQNNSGVFVLSDRIPYTDEMFAAIFRRPINTVRLALKTFERFGMVEIIDDVVTIPNWGKHQSLDQLEAKREYMRAYMREYRSKQREKLLGDGKTNCKTNSKIEGEINCKTNNKSNVSEADKRREEERREEKRKRERENNTDADASAEPSRSAYGPFENVFLSDEENRELRAKIYNADYYIERLSLYIKSTGKQYENHLATILSWWRGDLSKGVEKNGGDGKDVGILDDEELHHKNRFCMPF